MGLGPRGMVSPMLVLYGYRAGAPSLPPPHALYPKPPSTPRPPARDSTVSLKGDESTIGGGAQGGTGGYRG